jgi:hypothetical protein
VNAAKEPTEKMKKILEHREVLAQMSYDQAGLVTSEQAVAAGYPTSSHGRMVASGAWSKVGRGIYKLAISPSPYENHSDLAAISLWTFGRQERWESDIVFCRETALGLVEVGDLNEATIRAQVGPSFRRNSEPPFRFVSPDDLKEIPASAIKRLGVIKYTHPLWTIAEMTEKGLLDRESAARLAREAVAKAGGDRELLGEWGFGELRLLG